uniref:Uncharacterized protein n=1 Tax=Aegilops tauschii subsp. strangulata TaxID=200361 RepID=A0A453GGQ6_AEGTS
MRLQLLITATSRCGSNSSRSGSNSSCRRLHARAGAARAPLQRLLHASPQSRSSAGALRSSTSARGCSSSSPSSASPAHKKWKLCVSAAAGGLAVRHESGWWGAVS